VNKLEDTEEAFKGCNSKKDSYYKCPKSGKHNTENKRLSKTNPTYKRGEHL
jgi:hypothetical protein